MSAKVVWIAGLSGLAVLSAVGLYHQLPSMEADLRANVDHTLSGKGLTQVKAKVSGQTVSLTTTANTPEAMAQLADAQATLSAATSSSVANIPKVVLNIPATPGQIAPAEKLTRAQDIEIIHGDGATAVASSNDLPRVAGDSALEASTQAARSCDQDIDAVVGRRQVSYMPGTYDLTPDSQMLIGDVYKVVASCPVQVRVTVSGYTDNLGDGMVNQTISQARAQAAADALVQRGLAPNRVTVRGFGGALPVADNATPEGRAKNRRVIFTVNAG